MKLLLYLEDVPQELDLLKKVYALDEPDWQITAAMSRASFITALQSGSFDAIMSDAGVHQLFGVDAIKLARRLAPRLPFAFVCGRIGVAKKKKLLAAVPDGLFYIRQDGPKLAIGLLRRLVANRTKAIRAIWRRSSWNAPCPNP
jgi:CheY-like chemotaxis protein